MSEFPSLTDLGETIRVAQGVKECSTPMPTSPIDHIQIESIGIFCDWTGQTAQLKSDLIFSNPLKPHLARLKKKSSLAEEYSIIPGGVM